MTERLEDTTRSVARSVEAISPHAYWDELAVNVRFPEDQITPALAGFGEDASWEAIDGEVLVALGRLPHVRAAALQGDVVGERQVWCTVSRRDLAAALALTSNSLGGLLDIVPGSRDAVESAQDAQLLAVVRADMLANVRRLALMFHMVRGDEGLLMVNAVFGLDHYTDAEQFRRLTAQLEQDLRTRGSGGGNEHLLVLCSLAKIVGLAPGFELHEECLPVAGLYEWSQAGGTGFIQELLDIYGVFGAFAARRASSESVPSTTWALSVSRVASTSS